MIPVKRPGSSARAGRVRSGTEPMWAGAREPPRHKDSSVTSWPRAAHSSSCPVATLVGPPYAPSSLTSVTT